jgi:AcrR family transcriptional regulator
MPPPSNPGNRGPAAAAGNRQAILAAARRLFAEQGFQVPLSAIGRAAGVSQGVLYRHFRGRLDLAIAVFEDNLHELESLAAGGADFATLWTRLVGMVIDSAAFVEMVVAERDELPDSASVPRLRAVLAAPLARAQEDGSVPGHLSQPDLELSLAMLNGALVSAPPGSDPRTVAARALGLISPSLVPGE